jgi:hypothetical protein
MDLPYEIVHVIDAGHLIDSESYQRSIEPEKAGRLPPGFYIVQWPQPARRFFYDSSASYIGPFLSRRAAETAELMIDAAEHLTGLAPAT